MSTEKNNLKGLLLVIFTIAFYIATVLPHEVVGTMIGSFFEDAGRAVYDRTMLIMLSIGVLFFSVFIIRSLIRHPERRVKGVIYMLATLLGCLISMKYLIVINVEAIHFLQYALLSMLVFLLVRRYDYTIWIILLMAFFDESYQHFFLTPNRFQYLDFNDIFLDLVGGGFGLTTLFCLNKQGNEPNKKIRNGIFFVYGALVVSAIVLYATGTMRIWPGEGGALAPIQIYQKELDGFWTVVRKVNRFHIMRPLEGLIIVLLTTYFYSRLED